MTEKADAASGSVRLSALPHTWLIDVDGTVLRHNGHKQGAEQLLPGVRAFWARIPDGDTIILLSARSRAEQPATLAFFASEGLRFNQAIFGLPAGERILINDAKPNGLITALAMSVRRDEGLAQCRWDIDPEL